MITGCVKTCFQPLLSISKYYLPSGESISEIGVSPDIFVEEKGEEFAISTDTDNQLNYAVNLFSG